MAAPTVKTDWQYGDVPLPDDFNRIEQNIWDIYQHNLSTDEAAHADEADHALNADEAVNADTLDGLHASAFGKLGTANTDTNLWKALAVEVDTRTVNMTYDTDGRLSEITETDPATGTTVATHTLTYDAATGRLSSLVTVVGATRITYTFNYDANGRLVSVTKEVS